MYRSLFSRDIFSELDRLQQFANQAFDISPSIRGLLNNRFPAINVGTSPQAVEVQCFTPGSCTAKADQCRCQLSEHICRYEAIEY